ncbi:hypothetical protein FCV61_16250 [Vibrio sp. F12]|uniref:hypothetical protein n=1 Tax=Vibrio sp. F12 TaxID=2070776 RepID=UPI0010BE191C|nr:hypothetical protein [Vibrio sp. F12]TKE96210.1 hypothetical protein FCV61_16250 [Vibrio sp. F12]
MTLQANSYQQPTSRLETFSNGALLSSYTKPSNLNESNSDTLSQVAVAAITASLFMVSGFQTTPDIASSIQNQYEDSTIWAEFNKTNVLLDDSVVQKLPWLKDFYDIGNSAHTAKEVLPLISGIKRLFSEKQYSTVSDILLEMEVNKLSPTAMIAFISAAYPARNKLSSWSLAVDKVKASLTIHELDADEILKGLI